MELVWQNSGQVGERPMDLGSGVMERRIRRHHRARHPRSMGPGANEATREQQQSNSINSELPEPPLPKHFTRPTASNLVAPTNRLTLLDDPQILQADDNNDPNDISAILPRFTQSNRHERRPFIPPQASLLPHGAPMGVGNEMKPQDTSDLQRLNSSTSRRSYISPHSPEADPAVAAAASSFSSTTALLILLIVYIFWQCIRGNQNNKQPKCLDDWPAALLSPSKRRKKRRDSAELEMQTIEGFTSETAANTGAKSAVLRVHSESEQPEVEIVEAPSSAGKSQPLSRVAEVRRSIAKSSFVVAANRAARPRVRLLGEHVRRFVDIEAQAAREGHETGKTIRGRIVRLLHSSGLARAFAGDRQHQQQAETNEQQDNQELEVRPEEIPMIAQETAPKGDTLEVIVHNQQSEATSRCESLLGFAGSFLESTVNPTASYADIPPPTPSPHMTNGYNVPGSQNCPASSLQMANKLHLTCLHDQQQQQQQQQQQHLMACDCAMARSKSQSNRASCHQAHLGLATSPSNIRPCCSVSPSAMARHQASASAHVCGQQAVGLYGPVNYQQQHQHHQHPHQPRDSPATCGSHYCAANMSARPKHHYENYYDDEHEDAYRRLTASIGVQFGLALDQPALMPSACSMTCKCSSATMVAPPPPTNHFACHHEQPLGGSMKTGGGGGGLSSGESDSGVNFSAMVVNQRQRVDGENICQDSNCSLCQSSLLTAGSNQDTSLPFGRRPSLDQASAQWPAVPVPRWHHQRRSTLQTARQPRRMSIAALVGSSNPPATAENQANQPHHQQHFLHRASIASDGFHRQYNTQKQQQHPLFGASTSGTTTAAAARQSNYPACQYFTHKASGYSSAGSSSGIGFSGSQCLNTPTTAGPTHPYGSFAQNKPYCDLNAQYLPRDNQPLVCQFALAESAQTPANCPAQAELLLLLAANPNNRKFSLPAQLESHAAEQLMSNRYNPLFDSSQRDDLEHPAASPNVTSAGQRSSAQPSAPKNGSPPEPVPAPVPAPDESNSRRLSQIITRQSSFWLDDDHSLCSTTTNEGNVLQLADEREVTSSATAAQPCDNSRRSSAAGEAVSRTPPAGEHRTCSPKPGTSGKQQHRRLLSTSSSASSPSPDFLSKHRQRSLGRTSQATAITKRRPLGSLKARRHRAGQSVNRNHGSQASTSTAATTTNSLALKRQNTSSTEDEERDKSKQEDGLASFDREAAGAELGRTTTMDANSTASLERQCRDLWKLRATLHGDDGSIGDNWSNYHQRLNRRYDSGYKSIENQFSSSLEGNVPNMMNLSLRQSSSPLGDTDRSAANREFDRPRSGCSGSIQEQVEEATQVDTSPTLVEEAQALLENCDDQHEEQ